MKALLLSSMSLLVIGCACDPDAIAMPSPRCGDGRVATIGEECDPAAPDSPLECSETCELLDGCGDGEVDEGEECDDDAVIDLSDGADDPCVSRTCRWRVDAGPAIEDGGIPNGDGSVGPDASRPDTGPRGPRLDLTVSGDCAVGSDPAGIVCGRGSVPCTTTFPLGTHVRLSAVANAGATLAWSGDCSSAEGGSSPVVTVTMESDRTCALSCTEGGTTGPRIADVTIDPWIGTTYTTARHSMTPVTYDEDGVNQPVTELFDVERCDWIATPETGPAIAVTPEGCRPLGLGRDGDVPLVSGYLSLDVTVVLRDGGTGMAHASIFVR
jgi:hypothetical protein